VKQLFIFFCSLASLATSQTVEQCRQRFNNYLNFKGTLNGRVTFESEGIYLLNAKGQKQFAIYADEIKVLAAFFENSTLKQQEELVKQKGLKKYTERQRDSLFISLDDRAALSSEPKTKALQGYRIALDPGHFGTTLADAKVEQKYLYFVKDSASRSQDSIKLFESSLTFNTATLLKKMLEEQGADVMLTRSRADYTSFNCTYGDWLKINKQRVLDSLKQAGQLTDVKYNRLLKGTDYIFFWEFFRDYDLLNRANIINRYKPHVSVVIHYNVDEKNDPWKKVTPKNFCMAFIGGAFTADNLEKTESRLNFLRLLLTTQLNQSEQLAEATVLNFNKNLNIAIAGKNDAGYLNANCVETPSRGVFCRNLLLCRKINSVLVYGESLYQDNEYEAEQLMRYDVDVYGITSNNRLINVAKSYYDAVMQILKDR
jgi:N-acetylmuramoyl-L-alanine amidase